MSAAFHTVTLAEILRGRGYFPSRTPAQKPDRLIGNGPSGAIMDFSRTKPDVGKAARVEVVAEALSCITSISFRGVLNTKKRIERQYPFTNHFVSMANRVHNGRRFRQLIEV